MAKMTVDKERCKGCALCVAGVQAFSVFFEDEVFCFGLEEWFAFCS